VTCPDKIKLIGISVPILLTEDRDDVWGEWDGGKGTITLNPKASEDYLRITLLHEALHGIDDLLGLNLKHSVVYALSQHIWLMFKENPELAKWFLEKQDGQVAN
jgi:hypothetical protein